MNPRERRQVLLALTLVFVAPGVAGMLGQALLTRPAHRTVPGWTSTAWTPAPVTSADPSVTRHHRRAVADRTRWGVGSGPLPPLLLKIRRCESHDDYTAQNPVSTASGAYQVLDSTWQRFGGYVRAKDAPRWVQDEKALLLFRQRGSEPWEASEACWGHS